MQVDVYFEAQLRLAMGSEKNSVELEPSATVQDLLVRLTEQHPDELTARLVNNEGIAQRSVLIFVNESPVPYHEITKTMLNDGDSLRLLPPIAGG